MHLSCELAKALLIDAACAWTTPEDMDQLGYGIVPVKIEQILETGNDEIRFMMSGVATEHENCNFNFPIPVSGTSYLSVARATLCYFPRCNRNQGEEDCTTDEEKARKSCANGTTSST